MSISDRMFQLRRDLRWVQSDMDSISPASSLHKKLTEKRKMILAELEKLGAERVANV